MREVIENIVGKDLTSSLNRIVRELNKLDVDEKEVYRTIKGFNDVSILCMYLLSINLKNNLSYYIKRAYQKKMEDRIIDFKNSKNPLKYLKNLEKIDVINLAYSLDLYNLSEPEIKKLSEDNKYYYKILNNYINT